MVGVISENRFDYKGGESTMKTQMASVCDRKGHAERGPSGAKRGQSIRTPLGMAITCPAKKSRQSLSCLQWETPKHSAEVTDSARSQRRKSLCHKATRLSYGVCLDSVYHPGNAEATGDLQSHCPVGRGLDQVTIAGFLFQLPVSMILGP